MKRIIYIGLLFYITISGCDQKEAQKPYRPKIAVKCILKTNQIARAYIENTVGLLDTSLDFLVDYELYSRIQPHYVTTNAKVILSKNGVWADSLVYNKKTYLYEGKGHFIEPGATYRIDIAVEGLSPVYASCTVPYPVKILGLDTVSENTISEWTTKTCKLKFADPGEETNFYEVMGFGDFKSSAINSKFYPIYFNNNSIFENQSKYGDVFPAYFSDKAFNGKTISIPLQFHFGDSIFYITLANLSEEQMNYERSFAKVWQNTDNSFAEPIQVYSNISNGVGIFGAMGISTDTIRIK